MKKTLNFYWNILKKTTQHWNDSSAMKDSASLAYYAIFSIPGLLIIVIWLAGYFFGEEAVKGEINRQIGYAMGEDTAKSIEGIIKSSLIDKEGWFMKIVGVFSMVFGATTIFFQLQKSLNALWDVEPAPRKAIVAFLLDRANSLGMVLIIGFLMMITMVLSTVVVYFGNLMSLYFGTEVYLLAQGLNFGVGFLVVMVLFALIFKVLPDANVQWKGVWSGAFFTAILFTIGKFLLSYYFATANPTSAFGTAGTIILVMMWINYTCMLLFFGAEFTKIYSEEKGFAIKPSKHAKWSAEKRYTQALEQIQANDRDAQSI